MVELGLLEQSEVGCRKCVALGLAEELWFLLDNNVHVLTFKIFTMQIVFLADTCLYPFTLLSAPSLILVITLGNYTKLL